jgi:multiple sugar transport system substrate-binding protein
MFAAAGGKSDSPSAGPAKTVTLQIWGGVPAEYGPQASVEAFNEAYKDKGIQAEYTRFVNDTDGNIKLDTTLMSGDSIDVYMNYYSNTLIKRADGKMAMDMTDLINKDSGFDKKGFGAALDAYAYNGKYYCIPTKVTLEGIMINKDMFDAAGIPVPKKWTISEFADIAKKLTRGSGENKVYGAFINPLPSILFPVQASAVYALGGDWMYSPDGARSSFDSPVIKQLVQTFYTMMNVDKSAPSYVDIRTQKLTLEGLFLTGKVAMTYGSWSFRSIKDVKNYPHDFVTAFVPYPTPDGQPAKWQPGDYGDLISINPKSKNVEAAWEYVKWYTQKGMVPMAVGGRIPLYNGYDAREVTAAFLSGGEKILDSATTMTVMITPTPEPFAISKITNKVAELTQINIEELEAILNGAKTVDKGLADAKSRGDALLAK